MSDQQVQEPTTAGLPQSTMREAVVWAYRLLLKREPTSEAAIEAHLHHESLGALSATFVGSPEFRLVHTAPPSSTLTLEEAAIVDRFRPFFHGPAPIGFWYDFLGVRTRCAFLPVAYDSLPPFAHQGLPGMPGGPIHDKEEWIGTFRSLLEVQGRLVVMELGAGWGPWLVASAVAAARVGISDMLLIGVEGSAGHVGFMEQHMRENGIDPAGHRLIHGVVGAADGVARFPRLTDPRNDYGSHASYDALDLAEPDTQNMEEVPCWSLDTLLAGLNRVDLLHCDVQGTEGVVFAAAGAVVNAKVRRVVIGTHSRMVEAELMDFFTKLGWVLEAEVACKFRQDGDGSIKLELDGCQIWSNPALSDHAARS